MQYSIREAIPDDVDTYEGNALNFWKKQGFIAEENILLKWGERESSAVVMKKYIGKGKVSI